MIYLLRITQIVDNSVGTQRSDMGLFKKFALNLTNVALPTLIAFDLVIVQPLSSMSGYINYIAGGPPLRCLQHRPLPLRFPRPPLHRQTGMPKYDIDESLL